MYTQEERQNYYQSLITFLKSLKSIHTITRIGSGVTGYRDIYSDIDMMISCESRKSIENTIKNLLAFFSDIGCKFLRTVDFGWKLVYAILENDLEFNVSLIEIENTVINSSLAEVIFCRDPHLRNTLEEKIINHQDSLSAEILNQNICFVFLTHMRKYKIARVRGDIIGALIELNSARDCVLKIQIYREGQKYDDIKSYNALQRDFIQKYMETLPSVYRFPELDQKAGMIRALFFEVHPEVESDIKNYLEKEG